MLNNFWYACEFGSAITSQPKEVVLLGLELVVFRDAQGQVAALSNRCAHRGDQLARGTVSGDCIACPYHGWVYNREGLCVHIPSNPSGHTISKNARVRSYPSQEAYGLVWVFVGDLPPEKRPPIPEFPEYGKPGWKKIEFEYTLNGHYTRVAENAIDISHLPFLHASTYGDEQSPLFELEDFEVSEWGGQGRYEHETMVPGILRLRWPGPIQSKTLFAFHLPNITSTHAVNVVGEVKLFMSHLPVDERTTRILYVGVRNFSCSGFFDKLFQRGAMQIFVEDRASVEEQRPRVAPVDFSVEQHVKADTLCLALRKLRKKYLEQGWRFENEVEGNEK